MNPRSGPAARRNPISLPDQNKGAAGRRSWRTGLHVQRKEGQRDGDYPLGPALLALLSEQIGEVVPPSSSSLSRAQPLGAWDPFLERLRSSCRLKTAPSPSRNSGRRAGARACPPAAAPPRFQTVRPR